MIDTPLVSIGCITYNHQDYIRSAIEGFLMQKTNFEFEIIIHDDASTDNTTLIIKEYALKYPKIVFPIFQKENQYSKGINPAFEYVIPKCKGKYIAACEGDDYWTDPYKLQKQVDFLEANPEFGMVHTDANILYESNGNLVQNFYKSNDIIHRNRNFFEDILLHNYRIFTCTVCYRKDLLSYYLDDGNYTKFMMGDTMLWLEIVKHSKIKYLDISTATRRLIENSASRSKNAYYMARFSQSGYEALKYIIQKHKEIISNKVKSKIIKKSSLRNMRYLSQIGDIKNFYKFFGIYLFSGIPLYSSNQIIRILFYSFRVFKISMNKKITNTN
jgi:glycosyltransferase involved in cell wall biosynthesis